MKQALAHGSEVSTLKLMVIVILVVAAASAVVVVFGALRWETGIRELRTRLEGAALNIVVKYGNIGVGHVVEI